MIDILYICVIMHTYSSPQPQPRNDAMIGLSLTASTYVSPEQTLAQALLLERVLDLRQELVEHSIPHALRGMYGISTADKILKRKRAVGLLVGSLAEKVWNNRRSPAELDQHKDVDVLILPGNHEPFERFESGIDWWKPKNIRFDRISTGVTTIENMDKLFWLNGNNCALRYRITCSTALPPGLYFPTPDLAIDIRIAECLASIDNSVNVIYDNEESFRRKLRKKLGVLSRLPHFIRTVLNRNPALYGSHMPFSVEAVPLEDVRAFSQMRK